MHPKITAKKSAFSKTLHPSAEKSSWTGGTMAGGVDVEVGTAGIVDVGVSSASASPGLAHSADP